MEKNLSRDRSLSTDLYAECKIDKQSGDEMGAEFATIQVSVEGNQGCTQYIS